MDAEMLMAEVVCRIEECKEVTARMKSEYLSVQDKDGIELVAKLSGLLTAMEPLINTEMDIDVRFRLISNYFDEFEEYIQRYNTLGYHL
jgi:hypothetical protein